MIITAVQVQYNRLALSEEEVRERVREEREKVKERVEGEMGEVRLRITGMKDVEEETRYTNIQHNIFQHPP